MEKEKKTFKIVQIVDQSTFIINAGTNYGIKEKDKFIILGDRTNAILDPETGKTIEELPTKKATIHAELVYEKTSICKTEWVDSYHSQGLTNALNAGALTIQQVQEEFNDAFREHDVPGHYKELNIKEEESKPLLDHDDSPVKLGDKVKKL